MAKKSEEVYKKKLDYNNNYNRLNYRSFSIRYNVTSEKRIISWLEKKPSLKVYLTELIAEDMEKHGRSAAKTPAKKKEKAEESSKKTAGKKTAAKHK
jgi:hypothetical protein